MADTTVIDYQASNYTLPYAIAPISATNSFGYTTKLPCFAQNGRLFFTGTLPLDSNVKRRLTLSRAPQMASSVCSLLYQTLSRYAKAAVELTDHPNGQRTLSGKHLVDAIAFTDHWL